ncbi:MAG: C39 family peptidase [Methanosarcinaceae archaeon]
MRINSVKMYLFSLLAIFFLSIQSGETAQSNEYLQLLGVTSNPNEILVTKPNFLGLYILNLSTNEIQSVTGSLSSGYRIQLSANRQKLGFKRFVATAPGKLSQIPAIYDFTTNSTIDLSAAVNLAGVPGFSRTGIIAFTVEKELIVLNQQLQTEQKFDLGNYVNLAPVSPNGRLVAFNDNFDQIWLLELATGRRHQITGNRTGYFAPVWSPDSRYLAISTLAGELTIWNVASQSEFEVGAGESPGWSPDSRWLFFRWVERNAREQITQSELACVRPDGSGLSFLTQTNDRLESSPLLDAQGKTIYYSLAQQQAECCQASITMKSATPSLSFKNSFPIPAITARYFNNETNLPSIDRSASSTQVSFDAPYLHQVYDVPNWFDGHWACGATSAMMGLAYYDILPPWPCSCSSPYRHTSDYGRYICENYEFNGFTYNIGGYDASHQIGYGGYGFIIQDNWNDTKGNMAKYVRQHGLGSSVDWSPSYAKAMDEVDQQFPFVLLNSLTNSGHYILVVGYDLARHSLVVNDPYGDKNQGYKNYRGKKAVYDWPGYHNGNSNLNIVHCYIHLRKAADLTVAAFDVPDTVAIGDTLTINSCIFNRGLADANSISYGYYWMRRVSTPPLEMPQSQNIIPALAPGDSLLIREQVIVPDSLPSRKYGLALYSDNLQTIVEMDENNNLFYDVVVVRGFPDLTAIKPKPESHITSRLPQILIKYEDQILGIDRASIRAWLDDVEITDDCKISANAINFTPANELDHGKHVVKVEVANLLDRVSYLNWNFYIDSPAGIYEQEEIFKLQQPKLLPNYPNPFNSSTQIAYQLVQPGHISVQIFNLKGRLVRTLADDFQAAGTGFIAWDGTGDFNQPLAGGIYFCRLLTGKHRYVKTLVLLK